MSDPVYSDATPMTKDTAAVPGGLQQLFSDPNFLSLLAGVASRLDPTGVGGALGGATQENIRAKAQQNFAAAQNARNAPPTQNPLTPEGVPGPTSRTRTENADGTYSTTEKGDSPSAPRTSSRLSDLPFLLAPHSPMGDMRGMSAEDIPHAMNAYNEGERLRQANVGRILEGYSTEGTISGGEQTADLQSAQADRLRALLPGEIKAQAAVTALNEAATRSQTVRTGQEEALGNLPTELVRSQIERAKDIHGTYTDYTLPNGQTVKATASEIAQIESGDAAARQRAAVHQDTLAHQAVQVKRWATEDEQKRVTNATEAEKEILGVGRDGIANVEKPEIQATIDQFNASADKPYIWHWNPTGYSPAIGAKRGLAEKVTIPPIISGGKSIQLRAHQIARWAAEGDPVHDIPPLTPKAYIDRVLVPLISGRK